MAPTNYFQDLLPSVQPEPDDQVWWDACRRRELTVPECAQCGHTRFPMPPLCPACLSADIRLKPVSGRGTIFSYTLQYNPPMPALAPLCPFNIVIVELDDDRNTHMVSNVVGAAPEQLAIGLPVEVVWEPVQNDIVLPRFRLCE